MSDKKKREIYDLHGEEGARYTTEQQPGGAYGGTAGGGPNYANYEMPHGFSQAFFGGQQGGEGSFFTGSSSARRSSSGSAGHRWFDGDSTNDNQFSDVFQDIMNNFMRGSARSQRAKGTKGGFYQQSTGRAAPTTSQPAAPTETVVIPVDCTLRDLYSGRTKNLRVKDTIRLDVQQSQSQSRQQQQQQQMRQIEKVFRVDVQAGYKKGTRIKYPATVDFPKIVVFEVREVPHKFFARRGNDLHWTCRLTTRQVQRGVIIKIPLLSGETHTMDSKDYAAIADGARVTLKGLGMPYTVRSVTGNRGDLVVKFDVVEAADAAADTTSTTPSTGTTAVPSGDTAIDADVANAANN